MSEQVKLMSFCKYHKWAPVFVGTRMAIGLLDTLLELCCLHSVHARLVVDWSITGKWLCGL